MGRIKNSGTSNGTSGSPQTSLEQEQLKNDIIQAEQKLIQAEDEILFAELDKNNVKYTKEMSYLLREMLQVKLFFSKLVMKVQD